MIALKNMKDKSYEEFLEEALAKIPLYYREWTSYHPSDPGITMLENLSAFSALKRQEFSQVTEDVQFKLLRLAGFSRGRGTPSRCLLSCKDTYDTGINLPRGQKIYAGDVCFETEDEEELYRGEITGVYVTNQGKRHCLNALVTEYGIPGGTEIFGENPEGGEEVYFLFPKIPAKKRFFSFYVEVSQSFERASFSMEDVKAFASLSWQMYTDRGVTEVKTEDGTCLFLKSRMVRVYFPEEGLCQEPEKGCYMIRCTLKSSSYDIPPKVSLVRGIFAEVCQRDTKSAVLLFQGERKISAEHFLFKSKEFQVFVEEEPEKFYLWEKDTAYQWEEAGGWGINLTFPRAPQGKQVMVICLEEEIMPFRNLGILYGYDNQEFFLPPFSRVYGGDFSLLIEERGEDGRIFYHKVFPECSRDGEVCYTLEEESGKITVTDCGGCEGARVLLGDYSLYQGGEGCAVKGAGFTLTYREKKFELENCLEVLPGKFGETMEEVHKRFLLDLRKPYTMVTAQDCQYLVKNIPGLSVDKAGVLVSPEKNEIKLVVKPNSREFCPRLSSLYKTILCNYLEKYRILNTKISVEGPKYVPIHVRGAVVVKKQYEKGEETVKDFFYDILDGTGPKGTFGGTLSFHKIYHGLGKLACVAEIRELSLRPGIGGAETQGLDICLAGNALYYPGEVDIEFSRT